MSGQQQQQGGGSDNSLDFLWLIVLVVAALLGAWYFGRVYIATAIFKIRLLEITLITWSVEAWSKIIGIFGFAPPDLSNLIAAVNIINAGPSKEMGFGPIAEVSSIVGWYLTFPVAIILGVLALLTITASVGSRFRRNYNRRMEVLASQEKVIWPNIAPVVKLDLVKENIDKGTWAMALTPVLFAKKHNLLKKEMVNGKLEVSIVKGAAARAFALQLGPYFTKVETLPLHVKALIAIFAARANRDRKASDKLLTQLAVSSAEGKINYDGVEAVLHKYFKTKEVQYAVRRHAYLLTFMATMLEVGRADGVLAVAEFIWLKPVDRRLWYMLSSIGRQTPFVEVGGPYAHWLVEKRLNRKMRIPMIDEAVSALQIAVSEVLFEPEEEDAES